MIQGKGLPESAHPMSAHPVSAPAEFFSTQKEYLRSQLLTREPTDMHVATTLNLKATVRPHEGRIAPAWSDFSAQVRKKLTNFPHLSPAATPSQVRGRASRRDGEWIRNARASKVYTPLHKNPTRRICHVDIPLRR